MLIVVYHCITWRFIYSLFFFIFIHLFQNCVNFFLSTLKNFFCFSIRKFSIRKFGRIVDWYPRTLSRCLIFFNNSIRITILFNQLLSMSILPWRSFQRGFFFLNLLKILRVLKRRLIFHTRRYFITNIRLGILYLFTRLITFPFFYGW